MWETENSKMTMKQYEQGKIIKYAITRKNNKVFKFRVSL